MSHYKDVGFHFDGMGSLGRILSIDVSGFDLCFQKDHLSCYIENRLWGSQGQGPQGPGITLVVAVTQLRDDVGQIRVLTVEVLRRDWIFNIF